VHLTLWSSDFHISPIAEVITIITTTTTMRDTTTTSRPSALGHRHRPYSHTPLTLTYTTFDPHRSRRS
jgi:hypothetical protein